MNEIISKRLDKWLWAARFFKTRSLAAKAISGGKVHLNGQRIKPARIIEIGNLLQIRRGLSEFTITVCGLNDKRRPAKEAQLLYQETEESIKNREEQRALRRLTKTHDHPWKESGRPTKRDRRLIKSFIRKD